MKNLEKFDLFGSTYTIRKVPYINDESEPDSDIVTKGITIAATNTIKIATAHTDGSTFSKEEIELTRLHEIVHAIFMTGQYNSCSDDEPLTEWVARCIYSLKKQRIL